MSIKLSNRVNAVKPSPTLAITARAAQMRVAGYDIIGLGAGEPDFDTPDFIKYAAIEAINKGFTKYTAVDGIAPLKKRLSTNSKTITVWNTIRNKFWFHVAANKVHLI